MLSRMPDRSPEAPLTLDSIAARPSPRPWAEGDNLPWDDPGFSERMLGEHLSQDHDLASRRKPIVDGHLEAIAGLLPGGRPARVLDLACGPGLYAHRLARRGHHCHGIDFAPAAIRHARSVAAADGLDCTFERADLRTAAFGEGYDLVLLLYGQPNVFRREEAAGIVGRAYEALLPGGRLLLELQTAEAVRRLGARPATWSAAPSGLFSDRPHVLLEEGEWDEASRSATERWYVVDAATAAVRRHAMTTCAYTEGEIVGMLEAAGFSSPEVRPSLGPDAGEGLFVVVGRRPGA
jgi:SAM-dependent methyltransferase